jgi:hypothetical protein
MTNWQTENGAVLLTTLLLAVLLSLLGGVAINFAMMETQGAGRQIKESSARLLAESGVEQVVAWLNHGQLPGYNGLTLPTFIGTSATPDVSYDAVLSEDDRFLHDPSVGVFRALGEIGRIERIIVYASRRPKGLCIIEVTSRAVGGVRRSVSLELGAMGIAPLGAAIQLGGRPQILGETTPRVMAHWGPIRITGDISMGRSDQTPKRSARAAVTGLGYGEAGTFLEDRWVEVYVGGVAQFDDVESGPPSNVHAQQDPAPGLPADPWMYQKFKDLAMKSGSYYVPDHSGRLYRDGVMDPARAQTPDEVFGNTGLPSGLIFVDTLDSAPPSSDNLPTLIVSAPYMEGVFFVNAHLVLNPQGEGHTISALSPPSDGTSNAASRVPVRISTVNVQGVLHATGTVSTDKQVRIFGSLVAQGGLAGGGLVESWYNYDIGRGLFQGLPTVFPLSGTWREWGS